MRNPQGNTAGRPSFPALADVGRRKFIGAVGAAGIAVATARVLSAEAATVPTRGKCFLGSNADVFIHIKSGEAIPGTTPPVRSRPVPGLRGVRIYGAKPGRSGNNLARHWPAGPLPLNQGPIVYSIYPMLDTVIKADRETMKAIQQIIDTAPPNSYLTAWHEALSLPGSTPPGATPADLKLMHTRLNEMCQESANVTYGSIFGAHANFLDLQSMPRPAGCPPQSTAAHVWESVPDNLGFYGVDPYGCNDIDKNMCFLDTFITNAKLKAASGYPEIIIAETNNRSASASRVAWFEQVATRMHAYGHNAIGILTFWGGSKAPLSGAWDPRDRTVIDGMNHIIKNILT